MNDIVIALARAAIAAALNQPEDFDDFHYQKETTSFGGGPPLPILSWFEGCCLEVKDFLHSFDVAKAACFAGGGWTGLFIEKKRAI